MNTVVTWWDTSVCGMMILSLDGLFLQRKFLIVLSQKRWKTVCLHVWEARVSIQFGVVTHRERGHVTSAQNNKDPLSPQMKAGVSWQAVNVTPRFWWRQAKQHQSESWMHPAVQRVEDVRTLLCWKSLVESKHSHLMLHRDFCSNVPQHIDLTKYHDARGLTPTNKWGCLLKCFSGESVLTSAQMGCKKGEQTSWRVPINTGKS